MKRIVRECICEARAAATITCLISLMPLITAENSMKVALVVSAMILASVVLPTPGGPHKIMDPESSCSICTRNGFPGPTRCSCPLNSSSVCGLIRSARGAVRSGPLGPSCSPSKRLIAHSFSAAKPRRAARWPLPLHSSSPPGRGRESSRLHRPGLPAPAARRCPHCQS